MSSTNFDDNATVCSPQLSIQESNLLGESVYFYGAHIATVALWITCIYLILALIFLGLKIWFTLSVTVIMAFEIISSCIQVAISMAGIIIISRPSVRVMHIFSIIFAFCVVLNVTAWIVLLAEVAVVSGPNSTCTEGSMAFNCVLVSQTIFVLGIILASFNFCFLFYDLLLFKIYKDFYGYLRERRARKDTEKYKQYRNTFSRENGNGIFAAS